jgi:Cu/Ag efflux protein CusF
MKTKNLAATTLALSLFSVAALAQDAMVKGVVKKVDAGAGKITLTSGPIKNLDMTNHNMMDDKMTLVYRVQDPAMLKQVQVGDNVQFEAAHASAGITITKLQKAK